MKKHIKYPSIDQFRNVIAEINRKFTFIGLDENGDAMYDHMATKPIVVFTGTIKLHGCNVSTCFNNTGGLWVQSRSNIITTEQDVSGFAAFVESKKDIFMDIISQIQKENSIDLDNNTITVFGEWAGGSIQKKVGIANIEKSMFVFGVKITPFESSTEKDTSYWVDYTTIRNSENRIYNISDYPTFTIEVDFNMPQLVQNKLIEITEGVEKECPVTKAFGFSGIGEGVVYSTNYKGNIYSFKIKGKEHSNSHVKTLASVNVDKLNSIMEFVDYSVTKNRFDQGIENIFPNNAPLDVKKMGELIRWVVNDINKEESDTMLENNLNDKDVNKYISTKVRDMLIKTIKTQNEETKNISI